MKISGLQKLTLIDYPGKVACTVFLSGCNFRCPWCYSPELVLPERIKNQPEIKEQDFFDFLESRKGSLDGVVICGGEPSINEDISEFIKKIKEKDFLVKLDTNGSNPSVIRRLIEEGLVDYIAMDVKAPLNKEDYKKVTGVWEDVDKIKESVEIIKESSIDYEFRTTVVPTLHSKDDIISIAKDISPARRYFLQDFRPQKNIDKSFTNIKQYPSSFLEDIKEEIKNLFEVCGIR